MKKIGMLGGMSFQSTAEYYRIINEKIQQARGDNHSAKIYLSSLDLEEIIQLMDADDWDEIARIMTEEATRLESVGSDCLIIATNTIHKVADQVQGRINIPLLHIADATAKAVLDAGGKNIGLLGTRTTMEGDFLPRRLKDKFGITVQIPDEGERAIIDAAIFDDLVKGNFTPEHRARFAEIIERLGSRGADAVALSCTEIPELMGNFPTRTPTIDSTHAHALAAVDFALS